MQPITRDEAAKQGMKRYYTGKPCQHGHVAERYVSTCNCCACVKKKVYSNMLVHVGYDIHPADRATLNAVVLALNMERGVTASAELEGDEKGYWSMVANYKRMGIPSERIPRSYQTYTLPEGRMP